MPSEDFLNLLKTDDSWKAIEELISTVMSIPDDTLNDVMMQSIEGAINGAVTEEMINTGTAALMAQYDSLHYTKSQVMDNISSIMADITSYIDELQPSEHKRPLLLACFSPITKMFDRLLDTYHAPAIKLPMTLAEGATMPTYAHSTDAAADLYALEDTDINAHTYGNKIRTGVSIQLPDGWLAFILPRSSIGSKTPFRLSNSVGLIDSSYRGELGILYDNTSDDNLYIKKGARIAQLLVMPSYQFVPEVVDKLDETERGEGGFGSTGE